MAEPRTLLDLVRADLVRAERLIRKIHPDPIDPQFRIASPGGDWFSNCGRNVNPERLAAWWAFAGAKAVIAETVFSTWFLPQYRQADLNVDSGDLTTRPTRIIEFLRMSSLARDKSLLAHDAGRTE